MLQRTPRTLVYLSAEELGITERALNALLWVKRQLETNNLHHSRHFFPIGTSNFNMDNWEIKGICGTVRCIGGWMEARGAGELYRNEGNLRPLLYPPIHGSEWKKITSAEAVRAIDHFLAGSGPDCWPMALADIPPA